MRISSGKSNLEVSSRGFALFVIGLILATFFGGALRIVLRSDRVHERILRELRAHFPRNDVQVGRTEIILARGLWPSLGLRAFGVTFIQETCGKLSFKVDVPEVVLPLDMFSLFRSQPRLGRVVMDHAKLRLNYQDCSPDKNTSTAQGLKDTVRARGIQPPKVAWQDLAQNLTGLELRDFEITYERNLTWKISLPLARIQLGPRMTFDAQADLQKFLPQGALHHPVRLIASGQGDELEWQVSTGFKEGEIKFSGTWDLTRNAAAMKSQLTQLPLKDLSGELFQMGLIAQDVKLRAAWLTCALQWDVSAGHFEEAPVSLRGCKLEGAYGRIDLAEGEAYFSATRTFPRPAKFLVQNLQIQPLLDAFGVRPMPLVFPRLGLWTGSVDYVGPKAWHLDGELNGLEMVFSNLSVRGKQMISHVHTSAAQEGPLVEAHIDRAAIENGKFDGRINWHMNVTPTQEQSSDLGLDLKQLAFGPNIQSLLLGGECAPLELEAHGHFAGGELGEMHAEAKSSQIHGEGWRADALTARARFEGGQLKMDVQFARAEVDSHWRLYSQLRGTGRALGENVRWRDVTGHFEANKLGGSFSNLSAFEAADPITWRAKGTWVRDGQLNGTLTVGGGAKPQVFNLRGERGALAVQDHTINPNN